VRVLVTGLRGTVGAALGERLRAGGDSVVGWDRAEVAIDDYAAMDRFVGDVAPDAVVHLAIASRPTGRDNEAWLVGYHWPSELAWICRERRVRLVYASTVMVFTPAARGPFTAATPPDEDEGYGGDKRRCEERVRHQNPRAVVARLGWQIGYAVGSNNMVDYLQRTQRERGEIAASTHWLPACSFLPDTADALARLLRARPGTYAIDSNAGWSMYEICRALADAREARWTIVPVDEPRQDQRMLDAHLAVPTLRRRLPTLRAPHGAG
jgi:dTDP-4-dehydrorhamnose reductase